MLRIPGAHVVDAVLHAILGDVLPAQQATESFPAGRFDDAVGGALGLAGDDHAVELRARAGVDIEIDVHLLRIRVKARSAASPSRYRSRSAWRRPPALDRSIQVGFGVFSRRVAAWSPPPIDLRWEAPEHRSHATCPTKKLGLVKNFRFTPDGPRAGIHRDVGVLSGRIEALNCIPHSWSCAMAHRSAAAAAPSVGP